MAGVTNTPGHTDEQAGDPPPSHIEVKEDYQPQITFNVQTQGNWNEFDLLNNKVKEVVIEHQPECIRKFRDQLLGRRHVTEKDVTVGTLGFCTPLSNESPS